MRLWFQFSLPDEASHSGSPEISLGNRSRRQRNATDKIYPGPTLRLEKLVVRKLLTTREAAEILGVSVRRVQALISAGRLPATKHGRDWLILSVDLARVADRKPGRPPK